jgi:uncharacterized membrane protein YcaP (DUF421 family)
MTAFDFAVTVALGAVVGSTAAGAVGLPAGLLALASLFASRGVVAVLRRRGLSRWVDNRPLMLFRDGRFHDANLRRAKLTLDDVYEALRLNGTTHLDEVAAVIIERNGSLSVLPHTGPGLPLRLDGATPLCDTGGHCVGLTIMVACQGP